MVNRWREDWTKAQLTFNKSAEFRFPQRQSWGKDLSAGGLRGHEIEGVVKGRQRRKKSQYRGYFWVVYHCRQQGLNVLEACYKTTWNSSQHCSTGGMGDMSGWDEVCSQGSQLHHTFHILPACSWVAFGGFGDSREPPLSALVWCCLVHGGVHQGVLNPIGWEVGRHHKNLLLPIYGFSSLDQREGKE